MDVVAVFDTERRFVWVNEAACRFYGRTRRELLGCRLDDFIGTDRAQADWDEFLTPERIAQGMQENVWDGEQDGRRLVMEVRSTPEFMPDGTCSSCATLPSGACSRSSCARRRRWRRSASSRAGSRTTSTTS
jgi:PAS domain S-box-containing protein